VARRSSIPPVEVAAGVARVAKDQRSFAFAKSFARGTDSGQPCHPSERPRTDANGCPESTSWVTGSSPVPPIENPAIRSLAFAAQTTPRVWWQRSSGLVAQKRCLTLGCSQLCVATLLCSVGQDIHRRQRLLPAGQARGRATDPVPGRPRQPRPADAEGSRGSRRLTIAASSACSTTSST
jgi:hypothetical protein